MPDEHDNHYFFPDPGLVTFSNTTRQNSYLQQLDHCFDLLIYLSTSSDSAPLHPQQWRNLLALPLKRAGHVQQPAEQSTQCSRNFAAMEEMLGSCMQAQGVTMELLAPPADSEEPFDHRRGQELVWQLCELNFRFELLALDIHITRPPPPIEGQTIDSVAADFRLQRQELISTVFPGSALTSVSPSTVGEGLASADWGDRYQRLRILREVMQAWDVPVPIAVKGFMGPTAETEGALHVERAIAMHYGQTFYDIFGCPPILPHRL